MKASASASKAKWSWILYDWANSAFATTVMAGFFPLFFKEYYSAGNDALKTTAMLGVANSVGSLLIAFSSPTLGAIADAGSFFKRFLFVSTLVGAVSTGLLAAVGKGDWAIAASLYVIASVAFGAAVSFYDALLPRVANDEEVHRVSGLGYAFGYLGGGILFALNVFMFKDPKLFGLETGADAIKASFVSVSIWWVLFALPTFFYVKEEKTRKISLGKATRLGLKNLFSTLRKFRELENVGVFLLAFFLYNDAVGTTIKMAVDYGSNLGLPASGLIQALLLVQFIGFPFAILFGRLTSSFHPKKLIYLAIAVYVFGIVFAMRMTTVGEFYILAALIGMVQGPIQALSRSYFSQIIPEGQSGQYFGFYNMLGKFTGLLGPILMGQVAIATKSHRFALIPVMCLFLTGAFVLSRVKDLKRSS